MPLISFRFAPLTALLSLLLLSPASSGQLVTDNTIGAEAALLDFLLGEGVEVSNITFSGDRSHGRSLIRLAMP